MGEGGSEGESEGEREEQEEWWDGRGRVWRPEGSRPLREAACGVVHPVLTHAAGTKMWVATAVKLPGRNPKKSLTKHHHVNICKLICFVYTYNMFPNNS